MAVRKSGTILSVAALFWGFLQAPFFHIHAGELEHPVAPIPAHLHSHFAQHTTGLAIVAQTADDDAVEIEWGVIQPQPVTVFADISVPGKISLPVPVFSSAVLPVPSRRGHDPPDLVSQQPRSPPA